MIRNVVAAGLLLPIALGFVYVVVMWLTEPDFHPPAPRPQGTGRQLEEHAP